MIRYYITDRRSLGSGTLLEAMERHAANRASPGDAAWIQIREKDLSAAGLFALVSDARKITSGSGAKLLVNTRVDVAVAAGADGAHLPAGSPPARRWRDVVPPGFLVGVSCHTVAEVVAAEAGGADYVVFGPVFAPLSKVSDLAPRGLDELHDAVTSVRIPVLALGGITLQNWNSCVHAGAVGVAGITLFQCR